MDFQLDKAISSLVEKLSNWLQDLVIMLPNLLVAIVVMLVFVVAAKFGSRLIAKLLSKTSSNRQINSLLSSICYLAILCTGLFVALGVLKLDKTVTSLLAGVGIIGLALGFAFQDLAANFMAGILMSLRRPFRINDLIKTNDFFGTVAELTLRSTRIKTLTGQFVLIPNKEVFGNPITNFSQSGEHRIDVSVGVSYGDDLKKVERIAVEAIEQVSVRDENRPVELFFTEFGGSSINFDIRFWISFEKQADFLAARSEAIVRIKQAFDDASITIPFPIRTLDFGIVGGETLKEMLPNGTAAKSTGKVRKQQSPDSQLA